MEGKPAEPELMAAREAAEKALAEAQLKSKTALEAKSAANDAALQAQAKAKADSDAQTAAEKAEADAPGKVKEAEKSKEIAATRAKETAKTAEPRDVTVTVYSAPLNVKITPTAAAK
jgi:membrane protein involved in colicin uptake